ncbi:SPla/RYanodine receptor (SPRY) domain-containing protein [Striga asiatica]|uniref:SPla/RYanodine receptor (SPRY) domain-containing protein n=1 Tax=Striga asiatica TaxID=4170 RepID=A0A5A7QDF6_STRAF|nr:SPla/RYanodine receptor (SPRY) domain-containing protein [Striga asiatica]
MTDPSQTIPKIDPNINTHHKNSLEEFDRMAAIITRTLIQLFGDEDIDKLEHDQTPSKNERQYCKCNKRRRSANNSCFHLSSSSGDKTVKKRSSAYTTNDIIMTYA